MKPQTKGWSLIETLVSTAIGLIVAFIANAIVFHWYDIQVSAVTNIQMTLIFTVISIVRGYCIRRFFNWIGSHQNKFDKARKV